MTVIDIFRRKEYVKNRAAIDLHDSHDSDDSYFNMVSGIENYVRSYLLHWGPNKCSNISSDYC